MKKDNWVWVVYKESDYNMLEDIFIYEIEDICLKQEKIFSQFFDSQNEAEHHLSRHDILLKFKERQEAKDFLKHLINIHKFTKQFLDFSDAEFIKQAVKDFANEADELLRGAEKIMVSNERKRSVRIEKCRILGLDFSSPSLLSQHEEELNEALREIQQGGHEIVERVHSESESMITIMIYYK